MPKFELTLPDGSVVISSGADIGEAYANHVYSQQQAQAPQIAAGGASQEPVQSSIPRRIARAVVANNPLSLGARLGEFGYELATTPARMLSKYLGTEAPPTLDQGLQDVFGVRAPSVYEDQGLTAAFGQESKATTPAGRIVDAGIGALSAGAAPYRVLSPVVARFAPKTAQAAIGQAAGGAVGQGVAEATDNPLAAIAGGIVGQKAGQGAARLGASAVSRSFPSVATKPVLARAAASDLANNLNDPQIQKVLSLNASPEPNPAQLTLAQQSNDPVINNIASRMATSKESGIPMAERQQFQQEYLKQQEQGLVGSKPTMEGSQIGVELRKTLNDKVAQLGEERAAVVNEAYGYGNLNLDDFGRKFLDQQIAKVTREIGANDAKQLNGLSNIIVAPFDKNTSLGQFINKLPDLNARKAAFYEAGENIKAGAIDEYIKAVTSNLDAPQRQLLDQANRLGQDANIIKGMMPLKMGDIESQALPRSEGAGRLYSKADTSVGESLFNSDIPAIDQFTQLQQSLGKEQASKFAKDRIALELNKATSAKEMQAAISKFEPLYRLDPSVKSYTETYQKGLNDLSSLADKVDPERAAIKLKMTDPSTPAQEHVAGYLAGGYLGTLTSRILSARGPDFQNRVNAAITNALSGDNPQLTDQIFKLAAKYNTKGLKGIAGRTLDALTNDLGKIAARALATSGMNANNEKPLSEEVQ
jgi:hypothetical protein